MKPIDIKLLGNKIIVLPKSTEDVRQGNIVLQDHYNLNQNLEFGTIIMIAPDVINVAVGENVIFPKGSGTPLFWENANYRVLNGPTKEQPGDIWAIT